MAIFSPIICDATVHDTHVPPPPYVCKGCKLSVGTSSKSGSNWLEGIEKWIILERLALISSNITLQEHFKDTFIGFIVTFQWLLCVLLYIHYLCSMCEGQYTMTEAVKQMGTPN